MTRCSKCGELREIAMAVCVCGALLIAPTAMPYSSPRVAHFVPYGQEASTASWYDTQHDDPLGSVLDTAAVGIHAAGTASVFQYGDPYDLEDRLGD